ncbi:MAG: tetratricopeptide repeat protein [Hormoscilla sp. GUM202]|nr:tetratricopeptide repeat protein [Hormoscilla sp. GUM202]
MIQQADNDRLKEALGHYKAGRLDKARAVYLAMLKQQPHQVEAMQMLGIIAYQTPEYDRAINYFQQVISIKPDWPETYNNLGASFWEQGKIEQAIAIASSGTWGLAGLAKLSSLKIPHAFPH